LPEEVLEEYDRQGGVSVSDGIAESLATQTNIAKSVKALLPDSLPTAYAEEAIAVAKLDRSTDS